VVSGSISTCVSKTVGKIDELEPETTKDFFTESPQDSTDEEASDSEGLTDAEESDNEKRLKKRQSKTQEELQISGTAFMTQLGFTKIADEDEERRATVEEREIGKLKIPEMFLDQDRPASSLIDVQKTRMVDIQFEDLYETTKPLNKTETIEEECEEANVTQVESLPQDVKEEIPPLSKIDDSVKMIVEQNIRTKIEHAGLLRNDPRSPTEKSDEPRTDIIDSSKYSVIEMNLQKKIRKSNVSGNCQGR
jgi:hypothetical protein